MGMFSKRKSYTEPAEIYFWAATINNWQQPFWQRVESDS